MALDARVLFALGSLCSVVELFIVFSLCATTVWTNLTKTIIAAGHQSSRGLEKVKAQIKVSLFLHLMVFGDEK